jgi:hypothetical protein
VAPALLVLDDGGGRSRLLAAAGGGRHCEDGLICRRCRVLDEGFAAEWSGEADGMAKMP